MIYFIYIIHGFRTVGRKKEKLNRLLLLLFVVENVYWEVYFVSIMLQFLKRERVQTRPASQYKEVPVSYVKLLNYYVHAPTLYCLLLFLLVEQAGDFCSIRNTFYR